jgi:hypothetical protein
LDYHVIADLNLTALSLWRACLVMVTGAAAREVAARSLDDIKDLIDD